MSSLRQGTPAFLLLTVLVAACGSSVATPGATATAFGSETPSPVVVYSPSPSPSASPVGSPTPEGPTPMPSGWDYSDLDGVAAPSGLAHRLPVAVMIDDNVTARPQSGMSTASIVIQAMADGGEDRYMVIWQEGSASDIGPARSTRPYFVYWATEYKPLLGHIGGDAVSLQQTIPQLSNHIYNEDGIDRSCPWHRITTRPSPHNDYTNTAVLLACAAAQGYPATYQGLPRRTFVDPSPLSGLPSSQNITIPYRTGTIGYRFDPTTGKYKRVVDGKLQIDPANGQQVYATDVVVMFQTYAMQPSLDHLRPVVGSIGSGTAIVFEEGRAVAATWKKSSQTDLTRFFDKSGHEIPLVRGEIFIQSVVPTTKVTY